MRKRNLGIALLLLSAPLFAEQRTSSNQASATLQINIFVRPSINVPLLPIKPAEDQGVIFNLISKSKLNATREEVIISPELSTQPGTQKVAVLRTITYTAE
jgi:hypothetical protein